MKYAVIATGGKQYRVSEGDEIEVDLLASNQGKTYTFEDILLVRDGETVVVGTPKVLGAVVEAAILAHGKGEKIHVSKFKAKVRYSRTVGFRPRFTKLKINKIAVTAPQPLKKKKKA